MPMLRLTGATVPARRVRARTVGGPWDGPPMDLLALLLALLAGVGLGLLVAAARAASLRTALHTDRARAGPGAGGRRRPRAAPAGRRRARRPAARRQLQQVERQLRGLEGDRARQLGELSAQVGQVREGSERLGRETAALVTALRRPQARGQWGEMQLRRVVEHAGMLDRCDFDEQVTVRGEDGALRPDLVVRLPGRPLRRRRRQGDARRLPRGRRGRRRPGTRGAHPRARAPPAPARRPAGRQGVLALSCRRRRSSSCCSCRARRSSARRWRPTPRCSTTPTAGGCTSRRRRRWSPCCARSRTAGAPSRWPRTRRPCSRPAAPCTPGSRRWPATSTSSAARSPPRSAPTTRRSARWSARCCRAPGGWPTWGVGGARRAAAGGGRRGEADHRADPRGGPARLRARSPCCRRRR